MGLQKPHVCFFFGPIYWHFSKSGLSKLNSFCSSHDMSQPYFLFPLINLTGKDRWQVFDIGIYAFVPVCVALSPISALACQCPFGPGNFARGQCSRGQSENPHVCSKLQSFSRKVKENQENKENQRKTKTNKKERKSEEKIGKFPPTPSTPSPLRTSQFLCFSLSSSFSISLSLSQSLVLFLKNIGEIPPSDALHLVAQSSATGVIAAATPPLQRDPFSEPKSAAIPSTSLPRHPPPLLLGPLPAMGSGEGCNTLIWGGGV